MPFATLLLMAALAAVDVEAEFWGRTVPLKDAEGQLKAVATDTHLVVEVKVRGGKAKPLIVRQSQFRLRVNGAKLDLTPDPPGMAAATIAYPDWKGRKGVEASAGPVIIGRPRAEPRFPGDPNTRQDPQATGEKGRTLTEAMTLAAWQDGDVVGERTGLLYFPWKGRVAKIMTLILEWEPAEGDPIRIKLR